MMCDGGRGTFVAAVRMVVDGGGERAELLIQFVLELLHGFGEVSFGEDRVVVGDIPHSLNFFGNCFSRGGLG